MSISAPLKKTAANILGSRSLVYINLSFLSIDCLYQLQLNEQQYNRGQAKASAQQAKEH